MTSFAALAISSALARWTCARPLPKSRADAAALPQDAWSRQRFRDRRCARRAVRRHAGARQSDRRPPHRRRLRPADRARAERQRRPPDADLEQRRRRSRELRQCHALRRAADRRQARSTATAACSRAQTSATRSRSASASRASAGTRFRSPMRWTRPRCRWRGTTLEHPMAVNVGNPHLVFFVPDAREVPLDELGPRIEHDPGFPEADQRQRRARSSATALKLRTLERGAGRNPRLRDRRLRDARWRQSRPKRAASPVKVDHDRRQPDDQLGARRARSECAARATHVFSGELDLEALQ